MMRIESAGNKKIKLAASLGQRKYREKEGLFRAEGVRLCEMAAESGWKISFGIVTPEALAEKRSATLAARLEQAGVELYEVPLSLYRKISDTETPQGILLAVERKAIGLAALTSVACPFYVVLDGVQDPGNAGAILRTADAVGADGAVLLEGTVDVFSDKAVRASMGSLFHLPICHGVSRQAWLSFCREHQVQLLAAALDETAMSHFRADFRPATAVVFGNEGNGVSAEILAAAGGIYIPMFGRAESLNVAAASAVILYEAVRQRQGL